MKDFLKKHKKIIIIVICLLFFGVISFFFIKAKLLVDSYKNKVYPNTYINSYNISNTDLSKLDNKLEKLNTNFSNATILFKVENDTLEYKIKDLNINIDKERLKNNILNYYKKLSFFDKFKILNKKEKKVFEYRVIYKEDDIKSFLNLLKQRVDKQGSSGILIMDNNRNLSYQEAVSSYTMNIDSTYTNVINYINSNFKDSSITVDGESSLPDNNESLKQIDAKVSSFSTKYNTYISRGRNLEAGLRFLDGTIINPGEVFSFFKVAGPYSRKGYVYYDEMIGNGVCQIASTIYNTALYGGLQIVQRYPHDHQLPYVPGGQDATVSSNGNASLADFKFKNTYKYPIYISAFYANGVATVEFWSNHDAKEGYEYYVESVKTGYNRYETYLHKTKDGQEIERSFIAKTYYYKQ